MKKFLQKWLGLELNNSHLNKLENEIRLLNKLNIDTLTKDVNKLKAVMIAIFPNYDSIYAELNRIEAKKTRRTMEDCIGKEIIDRKMETNIENLNNAINYNKLDLTPIVEKQIDKRLYDLIDKRFNDLIDSRIELLSEMNSCEEDNSSPETFKEAIDKIGDAIGKKLRITVSCKIEEENEADQKD